MSEAIQNSDTPSQCDRLLDYAYGELSGDELDQFKLHLLTCEKCKRELAGLERVRSAVKRAMPEVEPPVDKMAQLMLAAAQQKPKRGKVLMFARRVVSHPAYAAAAVFVLVATTVTINWSKHSLQMPAPEAPVIHEPVAATEKAAPMAQPAEPQTLALDKTEKDSNKEPSIVLKTAPESFTVRKAPSKKNEDYFLQPKLSGYTSDSSGKGGGPVAGDYKRDDGLPRAAHHSKAEIAQNDDERPADQPGHVAPKPMPPPAEKAAERYRGEAESKKVALGAESGRMTNEGQTIEVPSANQAPARESSMAPQGQVAAGARGQLAVGGAAGAGSTPAAPAPAAVPPPPPAPATAAAPTTALAETRTSNRPQQQKSVDPMALKKQFLSYAQANRCADAINVFQQIDRQYSGLLSVSDRSVYVDCLRRTGQSHLADSEQKALAVEAKPSAPQASKKASKAKAKSADSDAILAPAMK